MSRTCSWDAGACVHADTVHICWLYCLHVTVASGSTDTSNRSSPAAWEGSLLQAEAAGTWAFCFTGQG